VRKVRTALSIGPDLLRWLIALFRPAHERRLVRELDRRAEWAREARNSATVQSLAEIRRLRFRDRDFATDGRSAKGID
jgi:hypothetical protein